MYIQLRLSTNEHCKNVDCFFLVCKRASTRTDVTMYVSQTLYGLYGIQSTIQYTASTVYTLYRAQSPEYIYMYIYIYPHYVVYMIHAIAEKNVPNTGGKARNKTQNRGEPHCSTFSLAQTSFVSSGRWRPSQDVGSDSSDSRCGRCGVVKRHDSLKEKSSYLWFPKKNDRWWKRCLMKMEDRFIVPIFCI